MPKKIDLTGKRFGRLEVLSLDHVNNYVSYWNCKCDCGNEKIINGYSMMYGNTLSCGCYRKENSYKKALSHGMSHTRLNNIWSGIKDRCYNSNCPKFKHYGGRGIKVCDEWLHDFKAFYDWSMANGYKENLTIDRINNNGNYEPNNCRWVTQKEQCSNKRSNRFFEYNGQKLTMSQWAEKKKISIKTLSDRIYRGWSFEKAITTPVKRKGETEWQKKKMRL